MLKLLVWDGRILASGYSSEPIRLRDTFTRRCTVTLTGHTTSVRAVCVENPA